MNSAIVAVNNGATAQQAATQNGITHPRDIERLQAEAARRR
jgi:hypothetical protein